MKNIIAVLIFLVSFGFYLYSMVPSITSDDSGEFCGVCPTLGIAHSPGYPIYSMAGKVINTAVQLGNNAYKTNLISSLFIALTVMILFLVLSELSGSTIIASGLSLVYAFSSIVWSMANVTEVYGIAAFFTVLIMLVLLKEVSGRSIVMASFLFGMGLAAHYTLGLLIPGMVYWIIYGAKKENIDVKKYVPYALFFGVLGFSVIIFILLRAQANPVFSWEDPKTIERFYQVVARLRYGTLALAQGGMPPLGMDVIYSKLVFFVKTIIENITWAGLLLFGAGVYYSLRDKIRGWMLLILLICSGPGFLFIANVELTRSSIQLLERFLFLPFIVIIMICATALSKFYPKLSLPVFILPVYLASSNLPALNHRQEYIFLDYAKNIIRTLPQDSILFMDRADEMEFGVAYLLKAEKKRTDLDFTDCNAGVSKSIYGDNYYRIWGKPRLMIREKTERAVIENTDRPVYYATFDPKMIDIPRKHSGLVYSAKPVSSRLIYFPYDQIYSLRTNSKPEYWDERYKGILMSYFHLVGTYMVEIGSESAAEGCFQAISVYNRNGYGWESLAYQYHSKGKSALAEKYYDLALKKGQVNTSVLINLGTLKEAKGNTFEAERLYNRAITLEPTNEQAHYNLAVLYLHTGMWGKVIKELEIVLKLNPGNAAASDYLKQARKRLIESNL